MYRNLMNRWWTFTLACVLGLVLLTALPGRGLATTVSPGGSDPGIPQGPGSSGAGDPDVPTNTGRSAPVSGGYHLGVGSIRRAPSGPKAEWNAPNAWAFRIRIALQGVRLFYLHD
jgi:hypothetical protein